jgi:hypothetical protein
VAGFFASGWALDYDASMHLFVDFVAVALLAWIGYSMRKLVAVVLRHEADLRDRCGTLYPVYSRADVEQAASFMHRAFQKYETAKDNFKAVKAEDRRAPQSGEPVPDDLERAIKAMWEAELDYDAELLEYRFLIEGNIRVLNGQSTIQGIREEWDGKHGYQIIGERIKRLEKRWAEFEAAYQKPM